MPGTLIVKPQYARLTHDTETFARMDPYCTIKIGSQAQSTKVCENGGKNPNWGSSCLNFRISSEDVVNVEVWDKDFLSKNDLIGQGSMSFYSITSKGNNPSLTCSLAYKGKSAGEVYIQFEWYPDTATVAKNDQQAAGYNYPVSSYPQTQYYPQQQAPQYYPQSQNYPPPQYPPIYQQPAAVYQQQSAPVYQQQPAAGYQQQQAYQQPAPNYQNYQQQPYQQQKPSPYQSFPNSQQQTSFQSSGYQPAYQQPAYNAGFGGGYNEWTVGANITKYELKKYRDRVFNRCDRDRSGYLSHRELYEAICELFGLMNHPSPPENYVYSIMYNFDRNGDGKISYKEFKKVTKHVCKFQTKQRKW